MDTTELAVRTGAREQVVDLTARCEQFLADVGAILRRPGLTLTMV